MTEDEIFAAALELTDPTERAAFLLKSCAGDETLQLQVAELLAAYDQAGAFLEKPAVADDTGPTAKQDGEPPPSEDTLHGATRDFSAGVRIGPYKILQRLGEGGMGVVYLAEQIEPVQRRVAMKIMKLGEDSAHVLARFEAERQALALMDHPNIAKVLDAGNTPASEFEAGRPYFVMEFVKGVPITKYCDQAHLTPKERLDLFMPICAAVQHAHQKGIIHRDLKPSNVLVALYDGKPVPKVIDFGVAKATQQKLTERTIFTEIGQIIGTLEYMAPEQAEVNNLDIDTRADIYSLGVILYELLTGTPPFTGAELRGAAYTEMLRMLKDVEPPKPSTKLSNSTELPTIAANRKLEPKRLTHLLNGDLDWIVMKCLEKDRNRRYDTATGLALDLQRYLADEPVLAGPPTAAYRLRKFLVRHSRGVAAAAAILMALIGGVIGTSLGLARALTMERKASAEAERATAAEQLAVERLAQVSAERDRAETAERRTQEEAAVAQAVNDFLQKDLLAQADPEKLNERDVKLRTVLDRAALRVEGRFGAYPVVEAALRFTLGKTYGGLGDYGLAVRHLERSLELRRQELGRDHPDTVKTMNVLAINYNRNGRHRDGEALMEEALAIKVAIPGAAGAKTAAARPVPPVAVPGADAAGDTTGLEARNQLAASLYGQGKYTQAETLWQQVLAEYQEKLGAKDWSTLIVMNNLAAAQLAQGQTGKAAGLRLKALEGFRELLGDDHPSTLSAMNRLGEVYFKQSRWDEAEKMIGAAYEGRQRALGDDHPDTLQSLNNMGVLLLTRKKYVEAEPLLARCLEKRRGKLGVSYADTLTCQGNLAMLYERRGDYAKAENLLVDLLTMSNKDPGESHPHTLTQAFNLAEVYFFQGKHAEAEKLFRRNAELRRSTSEEKLRPQLAGELEGLAWVLVDQKRFAEAEPLLRESLSIRLNSKSWRRHLSESLLGACLLHDKKHQEAEPLLLAAARGMSRREQDLTGGNARSLPETLQRLVQLYEATGQGDEAARWRTELMASKKAVSSR